MTEDGPLVGGSTQRLININDLPHYDTGVIAKPAPGSLTTINHNLNAPLHELDVTVMVQSSTMGWQRLDSSLFIYSGSNYGFSLIAGDNDTFGFRHSTTYLAALNTSGGVVTDITNIRIIVRNQKIVTNNILNAAVGIGTDYSTDETPVWVMDAVTQEIRQKLDIDGSPIFERTVQGTVTGASGTWLSISSGVAGIKHALGYDGWWVMDPANPNQHGPIPVFRTSTMTLANTYAFLPQISSSGGLAISTCSAYARTDSPFQLHMVYTKLYEGTNHATNRRNERSAGPRADAIRPYKTAPTI
jgi:hypothetical protein